MIEIDGRLVNPAFIVTAEIETRHYVNGSASWQRRDGESARDFIIRVFDEAPRPAVVIMRPARE